MPEPIWLKFYMMTDIEEIHTPIVTWFAPWWTRNKCLKYCFFDILETIFSILAKLHSVTDIWE